MQKTPGLGVAAAQLVADVSQGATKGEAEQDVILPITRGAPGDRGLKVSEVVPAMSMVVTELMMVTDP